MGTDQQHTVTQPTNQSQGSIISSIFWMTLLSVLLSWLPALGPLIAGYVGGKKAGGVGKALMAAILPAVILGGLILTIGASLQFPLIGALLGGATTVVILAHTSVLLVGALIGGALS